MPRTWGGNETRVVGGCSVVWLTIASRRFRSQHAYTGFKQPWSRAAQHALPRSIAGSVRRTLAQMPTEARARQEVDRLDREVAALSSERDAAEDRLRSLRGRHRVASAMESAGLPPLPFTFVAGAIGGGLVAGPGALGGLPGFVWGPAAVLAAGAAGTVWWRWFSAPAAGLAAQAEALDRQIDGLTEEQAANRARRAVLVSDEAVAARAQSDQGDAPA